MTRRTHKPSHSGAWQAAADAGEDMAQLEYLLSLTPEQRLSLHERFRLGVKAFREAGRRLYGFDPSNSQTPE